MRKDIDRNITRQLWEQLKNTFSRNDVIPIENGGTGASNSEKAIRNFANNTTHIRSVHNTYKDPNLQTMNDAILYVNSNSLFLDIYGDNKIITPRDTNTYIACIFRNIDEFKGIKFDVIYGASRAHVYVEDGTVTFSFYKTGTDSFGMTFLQRYISII